MTSPQESIRHARSCLNDALSRLRLARSLLGLAGLADSRLHKGLLDLEALGASIMRDSVEATSAASETRQCQYAESQKTPHTEEP